MYHTYLEKIEGGMTPVRVLLAALNILRLGVCMKYEKSGKVPWRALLSRLIQRRTLDPFGNWPNPEGMVPTKLLPSKNIISMGSCANVSDMVPERLLLSNLRGGSGRHQ
jgi:hypothetical protein